MSDGGSGGEPRGGSPRTAGAAPGSLAARFRRLSTTAASGRIKRRRPSSASARIACLAPVRESRRSGRQHRHGRMTAPSSRAGPPGSFKENFRARRKRSISAASRGTTRSRGRGLLHQPDTSRGETPGFPASTRAGELRACSRTVIEEVFRRWGNAGQIACPAVDPSMPIPWISRVAEPKPADRKSAGTPGVLEVPVRDGGPSRTRTLDPLIKSERRKRTRKQPPDSRSGKPRPSA